MLQQQLLLTPESAAERLAIGERTLYRLLEAGELPSVRIGRSRRIPADALVEYVERLRAEQGQPVKIPEPVA